MLNCKEKNMVNHRHMAKLSQSSGYYHLFTDRSHLIGITRVKQAKQSTIEYCFCCGSATVLHSSISVSL